LNCLLFRRVNKIVSVEDGSNLGEIAGEFDPAVIFACCELKPTGGNAVLRLICFGEFEFELWRIDLVEAGGRGVVEWTDQHPVLDLVDLLIVSI
jgi:hypothetical protein